MRNRSAKRRNRNKLARSSANLRKNSLSLGRLIVAEDGTDVPVFLSEMSRPAGSLFLLTGTLLAGQLGLLGDVTGEDVRMSAVQAANVEVEVPQVPGLDKRVKQLHVTDGLEVGLL